MFTGIVQAKVEVLNFVKKAQFARLTLALPAALGSGLTTGASIAVNGACLTVTEIIDAAVSFDLIMETLRITNLDELQPGSWVNVERAARFGDEIGGHQLSGHIHDTVTVCAIDTPPDNCILRFAVPPTWRQYIFAKGYVGLNGASLTIAAVADDCFTVYLIPETLRITTFGQIRIGDRVNLEIDTQTQCIVDTVTRMLTDTAHPLNKV